METIKKTARFAGLMYLIFIVLAFIADQFASFESVSIETMHKIVASQKLFTVGLLSNILSALFFLLAAWALYMLLKPVDKNVALLFLLLNLTGVAIHCVSVIFLFASQQLMSGAEYLNVFNPDQLNAQAVFYMNVYQNGFISAQAFYGLWLLPLGYLIYKSAFLPKILGILIIIDCFAILFWFFQYFLLPDMKVISYINLAISLIAEVGLTFWLLIKGVKIQVEKP